MPTYDWGKIKDWGTSIVDAGGSFHDIATNAFDSLSSGAKQPLNVTEKLLREDFSDTWNSFREKTSAEFGLDAGDDYLLKQSGRNWRQDLRRMPSNSGRKPLVELFCRRLQVSRVRLAFFFRKW